MKFEVRTTLLNGYVKSFITKEYEEYSPVIEKVNGLLQIGFVKEGKTRMTWTPIAAGEKMGHNVAEIVITEASTGRRIETIISKH